MNYLLWLQLLTTLAETVAKQKGSAPRELAYLSLLTSATTLTSLTDSDLTALKAKYEQDVASGAPVTPEELEAIAGRLTARSERIQGA